MKLRVGDKVRIKGKNESAEIIEVIDEFRAIVDTFDGELKVNNHQVEPFVASDIEVTLEKIYYFEPPKEKFVKPEPAQPSFMKSTSSRFHTELDLHAVTLLGQDAGRKSRDEIFAIQLNRLKSYLNEAISLKIQRVYIIHGIGSGRLKNEVHRILEQMEDVKSYSNSYHPKYAKGATEVKLS